MFDPRWRRCGGIAILIVSARKATKREVHFLRATSGRCKWLIKHTELSNEDFARAIPRRQRERIMRGEIDAVKDVVALRRFAG